FARPSRRRVSGVVSRARDGCGCEASMSSAIHSRPTWQPLALTSASSMSSWATKPRRCAAATDTYSPNSGAWPSKRCAPNNPSKRLPKSRLRGEWQQTFGLITHQLLMRDAPFALVAPTAREFLGSDASEPAPLPNGVLLLAEHVGHFLGRVGFLDGALLLQE